MFKKILIAEDMDFINSGIKSELLKLGIQQIANVQYCDEALLKLKRADLENNPFDLLISDLSFEANYHKQKITNGTELIKEARLLFPLLKIIVFSVEDKYFKIQSLFKKYQINGYVWKNRDGLRELKQAMLKIYDNKQLYISSQIASSISKSNAIEISDYDIFIIECLSKGYFQDQISQKLQEKQLLPTSISAIEKKLKFLKEHFNANNTTHLVSIAKDLGLI
ncbi:response regulator [Lutibacter sp.]